MSKNRVLNWNLIFRKIEFQNMGISLISLGNWAKCWIFILFFFKKRVKAHFLPYIYITIGERMKRTPILFIRETKLCICATRLLLIRSWIICVVFFPIFSMNTEQHIYLVAMILSIAMSPLLPFAILPAISLIVRIFFLLYYLGTSNYSHKKKWN